LAGAICADVSGLARTRPAAAIAAIVVDIMTGNLALGCSHAASATRPRATSTYSLEFLLARMKIRTSAYRRDVADDVTGAVRVAPFYDLVSTLLYVPKDGLALTLNGSADWPKSLDAPRLNPLRSCPWP
jgi:hypothetical protein